MKNIKNDNSELEIKSFDFENSKPNRYYQNYDENNQTIIIKSDSVRTIALDLDIADYFPDSQSVNFALRSLINAIPANWQKTSFKSGIV
jgi:hypothetical protein